MTESRLQIGGDRLRQVRLVVYILALLFLWHGVRGLWRLRPDIGQPFAGVPVTWDRINGYMINVEVPWNWPGPQSGLHGDDNVIHIDGQDPYFFFKRDFRDKRAGDTVVYDVNRRGQLLTISVPVGIFTFERFFEFYGFWFLAGVSCAVASVLFIRTATDEARVALSLAFLMIAAVFFSHSFAGCVSHYCFRWPLLNALIWHYGYPIIGALLLHFALVFPRMPGWLARRPRLRYLPLSWALALGTVYFLGNTWFLERPPIDIVWNLFLFTISFGGIVVTLRPIWSYFRPGTDGRGWAVTLGSVWAVGVILLMGVGVLPFASHGGTMILTEILLPLCMIYPLMLVYAVRNMDYMDQLRKEIAEKVQFADEVSELRGIRERTLHEVADQLHDTVVSDARGLHLWTSAIQKRLRSHLDLDEAEEIDFLERTLRKIYADGRRIMEGAKPVDFAEEGLTQPLRRLVSQANSAGWWETEVRCVLNFDDRAVDPQMAEDIYWIVRTALNNCRDHARAQNVAVQLHRVDSVLHVLVGDDGCGFSPLEEALTSADPDRRHLGLRNMYVRAQRLNADLEIDSDSEGTSVRLVVPLGGER